jgi:hypothetical protein
MLRRQLDRETRERLKQTVDAFRREQIRRAGGLNATRDWLELVAPGRRRYYGDGCAGCGGPLGWYNFDCSVCDHRRWKRGQRERAKATA